MVDDVWDELEERTNRGTEPYRYDDVAKAVRRALEGRAVVQLPDPNRRHDECGVDAGFWHLKEPGPGQQVTDVMSYEIDGEPYVYTGPGPDYAYTVAAMRERCLAGLAACADAERLASVSRKDSDTHQPNDHDRSRRP